MSEWADIAFVIAADGESPVDHRIAVLQRYGRVVIATVAHEEASALRAVETDGLTVVGQRDDLDEEVLASLDDAERIALEGYWLRHSADYQRSKAERPGQGASWSHPDFLPPDPPEGVDLATVAGMNDRFRGSLALGLVIVSGPGDLAFSALQCSVIAAEVQSGLSWLGGMWQLQQVTIDVEISVATITTVADPGAKDLEALWRDPAMVAIGRGRGFTGVLEYARSLKATKGTDNAYVAFFTHYPLHHFAYARPSWPETVMQYSNDGWTPLGIDRTFAHESAHIFGAPDEYEGSPCQCGDRCGYYHVPNNNCARCPGGGSSCIMSNSLFVMCAWTPRHVGAPVWWVNGADYVASPPVVVDGFIYYRGTNDSIYRVRPDGTDASRLGDNKTSSTPFVTGGVIYYRGTNDYIYRVDTDGQNGRLIGSDKTSSTPVVADGVIYYRGTNDYIYRVDTDGQNGRLIGSDKTSSTPVVADGVIYYRGTNNSIYRVDTDGQNGGLVGDNLTSASPFVADGVIYYRGTNDRLYRVDVDGRNGALVGDNLTAASPFVADGFIYYQGTNGRLYRVRTDGSDGQAIGTEYVHSTPFVADSVVYVQGTANQLLMINLS